MSNYTPNLLLVIQIEEAFASTTLGNGITLLEAEEIDNRESPEVRTAARAGDINIRWQDVPDERIESLSSAWFFLDVGGFLYYLPAAMRWAIKVGRNSDSSTTDNVLHQLGREDRFQQYRNELNAAQRAVVAAWTMEMFDRYWIGPDAKDRFEVMLQFWRSFTN